MINLKISYMVKAMRYRQRLLLIMLFLSAQLPFFALAENSAESQQTQASSRTTTSIKGIGILETMAVPESYAIINGVRYTLDYQTLKATYQGIPTSVDKLSVGTRITFRYIRGNTPNGKGRILTAIDQLTGPSPIHPNH